MGGGKNEFANVKFEQFKQEIRLILNKSITDDDIIEMLAQHIIIKPVIDAIFEQYPFTKYNPVALAMTEMVESLDNEGMKKANAMLDAFYDSVKIRMRNIKTTAERQVVILELFEKFFKYAFPKQQEKLGIVYTPIEVVDFINQSVADILQKEFNTSIADKGVHILDPFTGTGTFITRLLQSGLIPDDKLIYKYNNEIHANEIVPLSYYVASMNIESTYYEITSDNNYRPNNITILTDTFEKHEVGNFEFKSQLMSNNKKIENVQNSDIRVIVGNPPYSARQKSVNDNNQNERYKELEQRITDTYVKESSATLKNSLFDSYIKAYRWASDVIGTSGIIGFVTNAGWINSTSADGMRKCFAQDFSSIYIYHLKGGSTTSGEQRQKEKDNIFGSGCKAPIAIVILVKNPRSKEQGKIYFDCVDDYLSREQKLQKLNKLKSIINTKLKLITPDGHNDWLNQRDNTYYNFIRLDGKDKLDTEYAIFKNYSSGLLSSRDAWVYNSNIDILTNKISSMINFYNAQVDAYKQGQEICYDKKLISWDRPQKKDVVKGKYADSFNKNYITTSLYRPFFKQNLYYNRYWNNCIYQNNELFPLKTHKDNLCICISGKGARTFSVLFTNKITDYQLLQNMQYFPRYLYQNGNKISAITDEAIAHFNEVYDSATIDADSIFYYIYGILHSKEYREKYANNLVKELPRIPRVASYELFKAFEDIGRKLADLHVNYESVPMYNGCIIEGLDEHNQAPSFKVAQLKWGKIKGKTGNAAKDKTTLIYNSYITIKNIPLEAQEYIVNQKSALDWIVDRYCVKTDKDSSIVNDCNDYALAKHNEKYIFELILRIITVSLESIKLINSLPNLQIHPKDAV